MNSAEGMTGFVYHPDCLEHRAGAETAAGSDHVERPQRVSSIASAIRASALADDIAQLEPEALDRASIEAVHDAAYVDLVVETDRLGGGQLDPDTHAGRGSDRAARLASGGAVQAADLIMDGRWKNAFIACRPPGHHAERAQAMGFCLYNHAAIAAAHLQREHGLERIAILDWDVHHGNGTQHLFERDASVFYASLHQFPLYPGTGSADERGLGAGLDTTLNCPMSAGSGDQEWLGQFESHVLPALENFKPEFLILSAGFDAHRDDPLGGCELTVEGFRALTRGALQLAAATAGGRLISILEGGYELSALSRCAHAHLEELQQAPEIPA